MSEEELERLIICVRGSRLAQALYECREWLEPIGNHATGPAERELQSGDNAADPTGGSKSGGSDARPMPSTVRLNHGFRCECIKDDPPDETVMPTTLR